MQKGLDFHESKFYNYETEHATCNEHLLRELIGLHDLSEISCAEGMKKYISDMNQDKNKNLEARKAACPPELLLHYE